MSVELKNFIKKQKKFKRKVLCAQISITLVLLLLWEILTRIGVLNSFITSSPTKILETFIKLFKNNNIFMHIFTTVYETVISFIICTFGSIIISITLYKSKFLSKVFDPYLTLFNSLPKVALGPIIIIWLGANIKSIVAMAVFISIIVSIQTIYNGFISTDKNKIKLMKTFNASEKDILFKVVIPYNRKVIINTLKINISMCLIGM